MSRYDDGDNRRGSERRLGPDSGTGGFQGYGSYGDPTDRGESSQRQYGGLGAAQVGPQQRAFDPEYEQWREAQMRRLDEEYGQWRQERQKNFSDEFEQWRKNRQSNRSGAEPAGSSPSGAGNGSRPASGGPAADKRES